MAKYTGTLDAMSALLKEERKISKNKLAKIFVGKYADRTAVCKGVRITTDNDGNVHFAYLLYVLRVDGTGILNTDGESRSYHPIRPNGFTTFEWI